MAGADFKKVKLSSAYRMINPRPAVLVISISPDGKANGMIAAWTTPLSLSPPLIGVSIAFERYTYELVKESGEFTLNVLDRRYLKQVHFLGTVSGRSRDKLMECGLTVRRSRKVRAPHVAEAIGVLECKVEKDVEVGDHAFFIARVVDAYAKDEFFDEVYDPKKAKMLMHLGGAYYTTISDETITP